MREIVVLETPLKGKTPEEFQRNIRFLLWCMRAEYEAGNQPIASHLCCPWFMDDRVQQERDDGIGWSVFWRGDTHPFYEDLGTSTGMRMGRDRCDVHGIPRRHELLSNKRPDFWAAFQRGEWPPHTPGFELATDEAPIFNRATQAILGCLPKDSP